MIFRIRFWSIVVVLGLSACAQVPTPPAPSSAPASTASVENPLNDPIRLFRVSYPLLRAARDFCKDSRIYAAGMFALNRYGMGRLADVAWEYGIGDEMKVVYAIPDGPAYKAGIMVGDTVVKMNGEPTPTDARSTALFAQRMTLLAHTGLPVEMAVRRGDKILNITVRPEQICGYSVQVSQQPRIDATADGNKRILVSRGMMRFATSDAALALVVAHEIAHDALGHQRAKLQLMRADARAHPLDVSPPRIDVVFARALESDADYVGLYIMARAGMPIEETPAFMQRMMALLAAQGANPYPASHPPSKERLVAIRKTIAEISAKRATGSPLVPNWSELKLSRLAAAHG